MPNFVKVDSKPFHHETYMGPEQEEDEAQQAETLREKSMSIKLKVENTVRWRWTKDAEDRDVSGPLSCTYIWLNKIQNSGDSPTAASSGGRTVH
jgi:RNA polymerase-associated protein LEO1